jgi:glycosyltransferase involved in cell wall biosynthesis
MKVRFIDYVGNPGGGVMVGVNLFLALQRLQPEVRFELVSYGPALLRYRRAFAEQSATVGLKAVAPRAYWRNAASSLVARSGLDRLWPRLGSLTRWSFEIAARAFTDCDAVILPWAHRHVPPPDNVKTVANLMDITCLCVGPKQLAPIARAWRENTVRNLTAWLASGHRLTAISRATVNLIAEQTGAAPGRIRAVPIVGKDLGAPPAWPAGWTWGAAPFIFYPGNFAPHKNHEALFQAFQLAQTGHTLVLSGSEASLSSGGTRRLKGRQRALADCARDCGLVLGETLISLGYVSEIQYRALLARAQALIMPSLLEGYGLPVDEALRAGLPVLCSDIPVFREVVGLAGGEALWFDPAKPEDIARALREFAAHPEAWSRRAREQAAAARRRTWAGVAAGYWEEIVKAGG